MKARTMTSHSTRWHPYRGGTSTSRPHPELTPRMAETQQGGAQDPKYIKYLLDPEEEYNCYFLVGNRELSEPEKIGVVKKMLLAHSLVFRRELQESHIKEKGIVEVSDMFPDTFKNLLRFVYGFDNTATLCFDEADDLFYVSEKYMITGLKARLATRLMQLLTPDNICSLMNNPACYSELELNSAICHILQGETGRVLATPQFLDLTGTALNRILEQEVLSVPEIELWRAALKWAKHKTGSDDGQVLRKQLAEQTKRIRICTFSDSELCGEVIPSGVVTGEEIQMVCVSRKKKEKLDALVDLCNEIQPRGKLNKSIVIKGVTEVNLLDHLSGSSDRHISKSLRLITKNNTLELWFFEFTARTTTNIPEGVKYLCDCTITISRITDYDNNTSAETPVTVVFREQVEYNKDFVVPVISNGQNVILLPNNKYTIKVTFTETHPMYFYRNKESSCTLDNDHFSLDYDRTSVVSGYYYHYSPMKTFSYRPLS